MADSHPQVAAQTLARRLKGQAAAPRSIVIVLPAPHGWRDHRGDGGIRGVRSGAEQKGAAPCIRLRAVGPQSIR